MISRTYTSWQAMKTRCYNTKDEHYPRYGGRGIYVCYEWVNSFEAFLRDMGERPEGRTLDRIDNERHYTKDNCRWATPQEQAYNRKWPAKQVLSNVNTSGIQGVSFCNTRKVWYAHGYINGKRIQLYRGGDFDTAVKLRLIFEDHKYSELMF